jgi:hypothetical protein
MVVAPPPMFSTTTLWRQAWLTRGAIDRAIRSVPPPGALGTTRRIALLG